MPLDASQRPAYSPNMTNTMEAKVVAKGDTVRSRCGEFKGNGFVHYILPDGTALVEIANRLRLWAHVDGLLKAEV